MNRPCWNLNPTLHGPTDVTKTSNSHMMLFIGGFEPTEKGKSNFTFQFLEQERFSTSPLCIQAHTDWRLHGWLTQNISQSAAVQVVTQHVPIRFRGRQVPCNINTMLQNFALRNLFNMAVFTHEIMMGSPIFIYSSHIIVVIIGTFLFKGKPAT